MMKITNEKFYTDKYVNVDTNLVHDLLIYEYSINNDHGYNIVIGEVKDDVTDLIQYLTRIMKLRITNSHLLFICSCINIAKEKNLFKNVRFSQCGYNLIFDNNYENQIYRHLSNNLKDVIIDPISKRFSAIFSQQPFYSIDDYENIVMQSENLNSKEYKKVITH